MNDGPAPLGQDVVKEILDNMSTKLSKSGFGVTLVHDANGSYGPAGKWYLTLRFSDKHKDHLTVSLCVEKISSFQADEIERKSEEYWRDK